ncbi:hypothetical protein MATL_G00137050 [Megalops atlanticus]|uniref:Uncharacterized protein n=1 Tax=Megalops atlanticus TaxID=7932 RepID=A0A9D3PTK6_MEGAT|nr:hypothetical protein MATL_G00137050 [Megalops atlanticus]
MVLPFNCTVISVLQLAQAPILLLKTLPASCVFLSLVPEGVQPHPNKACMKLHSKSLILLTLVFTMYLLCSCNAYKVSTLC